MGTVDREVAVQEFDKWAEAMDLDLDESRLDGDEKADLAQIKNRLIREIQRGNLVLNDDGEFVYTPHRPRSKYKDAITFHERSGASLMATNGKKRGHDITKLYAVMGDVCRVDPKTFSGLVGTDIKVCEEIVTLLMD